MTVRRRLRIEGQVQGVFFRDATSREAEAAGVAGWVRNAADGTVEAVLEGDEAAVARVAAFCERGPSGASVARVRASEEVPEGLSGFEVR